MKHKLSTYSFEAVTRLDKFLSVYSSAKGLLEISLTSKLNIESNGKLGLGPGPI